MGLCLRVVGEVQHLVDLLASRVQRVRPKLRRVRDLLGGGSRAFARPVLTCSCLKTLRNLRLWSNGVDGLPSIGLLGNPVTRAAGIVIPRLNETQTLTRRSAIFAVTSIVCTLTFRND